VNKLYFKGQSIKKNRGNPSTGGTERNTYRFGGGSKRVARGLRGQGTKALIPRLPKKGLKAVTKRPRKRFIEVKGMFSKGTTQNPKSIKVLANTTREGS